MKYQNSELIHELTARRHYNSSKDSTRQSRFYRECAKEPRSGQEWPEAHPADPGQLAIISRSICAYDISILWRSASSLKNAIICIRMESLYRHFSRRLRMLAHLSGARVRQPGGPLGRRRERLYALNTPCANRDDENFEYHFFFSQFYHTNRLDSTYR